MPSIVVLIPGPPFDPCVVAVGSAVELLQLGRPSWQHSALKSVRIAEGRHLSTPGTGRGGGKVSSKYLLWLGNVGRYPASAKMYRLVIASSKISDALSMVGHELSWIPSVCSFNTRSSGGRRGLNAQVEEVSTSSEAL